MKEHRSRKSEPKIATGKLKQMLNKMRPSERLHDAPVVGDELIPAFPTEKSEHEEESIDQRSVVVISDNMYRVLESVLEIVSI